MRSRSLEKVSVPVPAGEKQEWRPIASRIERLSARFALTRWHWHWHSHFSLASGQFRS
jgi:hypothetical protein